MKQLITFVFALSFVFCFALAETPVIDENSGVIQFDGSGVTICDPVTIGNVPARISFEQSEQGEFDVSCVLGSDDYSVVDGYYNDIGGCAVATKTGDYTFLVDTEHDWSLTVEPLKDATFEPLSGVGDCVTDIYTFSKPAIITLSAKFYDRDNLILYAYVETARGWDDELLFNELESAGFTDDFKTILKIPKETRVFFTLDFDEGEWSLDIT